MLGVHAGRPCWALQCLAMDLNDPLTVAKGSQIIFTSLEILHHSLDKLRTHLSSRVAVCSLYELACTYVCIALEKDR